MKKVAIIPALNCEKTISGVVKGLNGLVDEIIVIDDGSIDNTKHNGFHNGALVISHKRNKGLGAALQTGFRYALKRKADIIITLDGDGQHDPSEVGKVMNLLLNNHCDTVIGSRLINEDGWKNFPRHRFGEIEF